MWYGSAFQSSADDAEFSVIDLAVVVAADEEVRRDEVGRLARGVEAWGFFKVVNHGVPLERLQRNLEHVRGFFGKLVEEKLEIPSDLPRRSWRFRPTCRGEAGDSVRLAEEVLWFYAGDDDCGRGRVASLLDGAGFLARGGRICIWSWLGGRGRKTMAALVRICSQLPGSHGRLDAAAHRALDGRTWSDVRAIDGVSRLHDRQPQRPSLPCMSESRARQGPLNTYRSANHGGCVSRVPGVQLLKDGKWLTIRAEIGTLYRQRR